MRAATVRIFASGSPLRVSAAYVKIGGTLDANFAGHIAGVGPATGGSSTTAGAGGAGHGGMGGLGGRDPGDTAGDGDPLDGTTDDEEIEMGSGGGTTDASTTNGRGGGAIRVTGLRVILDGTIVANGEQGDGSGRSGGGGAGGVSSSARSRSRLRARSARTAAEAAKAPTR